MSIDNDSPIKILWINNQGGGLPSWELVTRGTSLTSFVDGKFGGGQGNDYEIRVNGRHESGDYILKSDDREAASPTKVAVAQ